MRYELYPLIYQEIPDFNLIRALNHGLLPRHYLSDHPEKLISAYIGIYLHDEIMAEAKIRKMASFSSFLEAAAFSNGETVNFTNIASDCGISSPTVRDYFQILEETMIGRFVPSFQKKPKRRVTQAPRFYYFDIGIANYLLKRKSIEPGSEGMEVDFILGDHQVAIEVKATDQANPRHFKGLTRFAEEYDVDRLILVSNDPSPRKIGDISVMPWQLFLDKLWAEEIIK